MSPVVRWTAPDLGALPGSSREAPEASPAGAAGMPAEPMPQPPTLEEIQAIQDAAYREGLEQGQAEGHAEGLAQGQAEVRRLVAQIEGIVDNFSRPLLRLEGEVVAALGELAVRVAGQLLGRAYEAEPALLQELVVEALDAVGGSSRDVEVRLHPDDIAALAPLLKLAPGQRLSPDPGLSRGDLRVHAESVRIDGTLDARLRAALSTVMRKAGATQ
ncbi:MULTISPECIES: FliH/SctL family protein [Stenotrophomonas]|uniref:Flagellar assembly protein FliH n=2 Tax=Stenotrophomonas nitritireducens TaxID=83617 RepID=A0ABR5NGA6_9GAMM|nr:MULTISPECIES: FliH/SctL family protein [Stenotrophomonas]KQN98048.1 flagellar assembly protein FliH [Stenotrophomonas sp. Leaf70]KRG54246.1 flagellar assembly protein FliH [Stenotrophomonas nitritireducens]